ncbi:hypothetical protein KUCAC02_030371 [Chaenocephalus aceratus]|uniref:Uncharacterized protein n=1 Tax=Chaenocephalus aceratus TaxID=36190 RepID=A0ACB9XIQ4_CHAAC|nr:hypothetical protein KUCAC02_030371 [Chaenocephalus aceratus]
MWSGPLGDGLCQPGAHTSDFNGQHMEVVTDERDSAGDRRCEEWDLPVVVAFDGGRPDSDVRRRLELSDRPVGGNLKCTPPVIHHLPPANVRANPPRPQASGFIRGDEACHPEK